MLLADVETEGTQYPESGDAQHRFLLEAVDCFIAVETIRDGAIVSLVERQVGTLSAADRYSPEHAGLELLARSLRHLLRRNYLTIVLLTRVGSGKLTRNRLEELMQMLTHRLSLLFEFAPPDFYERSTFGSYIATLLETGLVREDADGSLHLHEHTRTWERHVERLLPTDAVLAIRRVAVEDASLAPTRADARDG